MEQNAPGHQTFTHQAPQQVVEFPKPADLAELLINGRNWWRKTVGPLDWHSRISDAGVRKLLEVAFQGSLYQEEGRYGRLRFFARVSDKPRLIVRFDHPPQLDAKLVRRIMRGVGSFEYALCIHEEDSSLMCDGIVDVGDLSDDIPLASFNALPRYSYCELMVRIDGPGRIRVSDITGMYTLGPNGIHSIRSYSTASKVEEWLRELSATLVKLSREKTGASADTMGLAPGAVHSLVLSAMSKVLTSASALGHGGAFVIAPDPKQLIGQKGSDTGAINVKYQADLAVADEILAYWDACHRAKAAGTVEQFAEVIQEWHIKKRNIFSTAAALGNLSAIDGCVVMDRQIKLSGFGAEIRVADGGANSSRPLVNGRTKEPIDENYLKEFGTRHNSAFRLCKTMPGVLVVVLSQDGDLRVLASDDKYVYLEEGLSPSGTPFEDS